MRRIGNIRARSLALIGNCAGPLIAGAFTLSPGRVMHTVFLA